MNIQLWVELLAENEVPALMIIPNSKNGLLTNEKVDVAPMIEEAGYQLMLEQPKYQDPALQKYGLSPAYYYLYQLS